MTFPPSWNPFPHALEAVFPPSCATPFYDPLLFATIVYDHLFWVHALEEDEPRLLLAFSLQVCQLQASPASLLALLLLAFCRLEGMVEFHSLDFQAFQLPASYYLSEELPFRLTAPSVLAVWVSGP